MTVDRRRVLQAGAVAAVGALSACAGAGMSSPLGPPPNARASKPRRAPAKGVTTAEENAKRGDPRWRLDRLGQPDEIWGWADRTSARPGESVGLHISTSAPTYRVTAFRTGWYGGTQGRRVWRSGQLEGHQGSAPRILAPTSTVTTDWPATVTVDTAGWVPGFYIFRLDASTGGQRYIPLAVRSGQSAGKIVLINGDTTWQAYNPFGGYSLYFGPDGRYADRARAVSFDRPYGGTTAQGASEFQENLLPVLSLVERMGLPADYISDTDLHADPHVLDGALAVISPGHDEYYSTRMREVLTHARDAGTNLAFLGANAIYRHIRLDPTDRGADRLQTCYKEPGEDPWYGHNNAEVTGQWRYPPMPRPESVLTGVFYESNPVRADMQITNPDHWLFAGAKVSLGMRLPGLVGGEYDRVNLGVSTPRPIEVLAHSPLVCRGNASWSDMAYYTVPSGAGVLSTGTNWWINAISGAYGPDNQRVTTAVTGRMLAEFAKGPAGRRHPARDNVAEVYPRV
jgi:hypothetical protein